jgi:3-deoxy-7-phosphoheptulonate synthase
MIVIMNQGASEQDVHHVVELINEFGLKEHVIVGTNRTVIACLGDKRNVDKGALEHAPNVERIVPILAPYKIASREVKKENTQIKIGSKGFPMGGPKIGVIAGPCSVENEKQLLYTADKVAAAGCIGLRAGAFKPRTSPYSFQGLGVEGLKLLAKAKKNTGLAVVTEVVAVEHIDIVAEYVDVLQVGARNMQHYPLLEALGKVKKPILLKRGMSAQLDEFLLAAEYIINAGNTQVILCERGIRTFEEYVRNTLALAIVPELKSKTHLPVVVDPSHGTGHSHLIPAMCRAAVAAGADGLLVECHHDPQHALSDGAQSITPEVLELLMKQIAAIAKAIDRDA